ncbi:hypothetical protein KC906_03400 [Candidatus Kaiserbacteria bacterium]|nr:hypothetical protein [Candidatus Kaiserbacteria bacterium]
MNIQCQKGNRTWKAGTINRSFTDEDVGKTFTSEIKLITDPLSKNKVIRELMIESVIKNNGAANHTVCVTIVGSGEQHVA